MISGSIVLYFVGVDEFSKGGIDDAQLYFLISAIAGVVGGGFVVSSFRKNAHLLEQAIDVYSRNISKVGSMHQLSFGLAQHGIGIV